MRGIRLFLPKELDYWEVHFCVAHSKNWDMIILSVFSINLKSSNWKLWEEDVENYLKSLFNLAIIVKYPN